MSYSDVGNTITKLATSGEFTCQYTRLLLHKWLINDIRKWSFSW